MNPRKLFLTLTVGCLVATPFLPQAFAATDNCYYRVVNVSANDVLWMRLGPHKQYQIVGVIPFDGTKIQKTGYEIKRQNSQWMPVEYKDMAGWLNRRYLEEDCQLNNAIEESRYYTLKRGDTLYSVSKRYGKTVKEIAKWNDLEAPYNLSVGQRLRVVPPICGYRVVKVAADDQLSIRAEPRTKSERVGSIPFNGTDIQITGQELTIGKSRWVLIRYQSIEGWVNRGYLEKEC
ncbi:MAG: hypothetical protein DRR16_21375 [Candidatus Parabeggiatoa sp. nov. 3]|nr:MAG: hypothetical protein DRR00_05265 [Gammaproteobacteria bacterium]RKZ64870.1 MAG: hypothetical protein DRQ99_14385 [Gammaproteobacteria bacterium]RKZ81764.1 MAG: hypothetical protein DRR16_21375 [Gammaproteobacteria bacterium]HEW97303.1 LysM peptidoglycan-binding domain-containing protein [Beggiatoa sp.]